jgi:hypothetical protein
MSLSMVSAHKVAPQNHVEIEAVILLAILVKRGNLRPKQLQGLGYPKRHVIRSLRRLIDSGTVSKSEGAYEIRSEVIAKVRKISYGVDELDGLTEFLLQVALGNSYTDWQARQVAMKVLQRTSIIMEATQS